MNSFEPQYQPSAFQQILPIILEAEGGYVDDPADPGGATNKGITQRVYDEWRVIGGQEKKDVKDITQDEVEIIYFVNYWKAGHCNDMPTRTIKIRHFDACVNLGPVQAIKLLQKVLNVETDGIVGPITEAALNRMNPRALADEILWERLRFYREITRDESNALIELCKYLRQHHYGEAEDLIDKAEGLKFIRWWMKRVFDLRSKS